MTAKRKRNRRQSLLGWIKWAPVIAAPFSVLFFEAWLNTQTRFVDYALVRANNRIQEIESSLDRIRVEEARLQAFDRLEVEAPELGLQPAAPEQVMPIFYSAKTDEVAVPDRPYIMARIEAERRMAGESAPVKRTRVAERTAAAVPRPEHSGSAILIAPAPFTREREEIALAEAEPQTAAASTNLDASVASLLGAL